MMRDCRTKKTRTYTPALESFDIKSFGKCAVMNPVKDCSAFLNMAVEGQPRPGDAVDISFYLEAGMKFAAIMQEGDNRETRKIDGAERASCRFFHAASHDRKSSDGFKACGNIRTMMCEMVSRAAK